MFNLSNSLLKGIVGILREDIFHTWVRIDGKLKGVDHQWFAKIKESPSPNFLYLIIAIFFIASCGGEEEKLHPNTFQKCIADAGAMPDPIEERDTTFLDCSTETQDNETWKCTRNRLSIQAGTGGDKGFALFSPNTVIYPGNLLQGGFLSEAPPRIIATERAGGIISTDVVDGNIKSSCEVESISKSSVSEAINNIIAESSGVVPANFDISIRNIQSREQFAFELGLNVNTTFTDLEAKLNYSSETTKNSFIVNLNQSFYTMSFDIPTSLDQLFAPSVTPDDLARYVGEDNPACYISDVTYGRVYYMLIQSTSSATEMEAALNASFNGITNGVEGNIETEYLSNLNDLSISVFAYGGLAEQTLLTVGVTDINLLANLLAEAADIRSGKTISYVVRSVYDNQIVSTQLATEYDVVECSTISASSDVAPPYTAHWTCEVLSKLGGPVGAAFAINGTDFILFNQKGDKFLKSKVGILEGPFSIDELGLEDCPLEGIGAICNTFGNNAELPYLMAIDVNGLNYAWMNPNGEWSDIRSVVEDFGASDYPFGLSGIGAMVFREVGENGGYNVRICVNSEGDQLSYYDNRNLDDRFGPVREISGFNNWNKFKSNIGAGIGFNLNGEYFQILFDMAGTSYMILGNVHGNGDWADYLGPFKL